LNEWRLALEEKRLRISRSKTEYIEHEFGGRDQDNDRTRRAMTTSGDVTGKIESFKYLGTFVQRNGGFKMDVKYKINCSWMKWGKGQTFYVIREFQCG